MLLNATMVDVWAANIQDRPGGLAEKLEILAKAGLNLDFIYARRCHNMPGEGKVFLTPIEGERQLEAAKKAGFTRVDSLATVRLEGPDEPGVAYRLAQALGAAGINLRGLSGGRVGTRCVMYLTLDTVEAAQKAIQVIQRL